MKFAKFIIKYGKWINVLCSIFIFANLYLSLQRGDGPWFMVMHGFFLGISICSILLSWYMSWRARENITREF